VDLYVANLAWALAGPPAPAYYRFYPAYGNPDATPRTRRPGTSPLQLDTGFAPLLAPDGVTPVSKLRMLVANGGAGVGIGVQLYVYSVGSPSPVLVAQNMSAAWPAAAFSYAPPTIPINSILVRNASWGGPGDPPCPWEAVPSANPLFTCATQPLYSLTVSGLNFGPAASPTTNTVRQRVEFSVNGTFDSELIAVANWSDSSITAYSPSPRGTVRVCLDAVDFEGVLRSDEPSVCGSGSINVEQAAILGLQYVQCGASGACTGGGYAGPFSHSGLAGAADAPPPSYPGPYFVSLTVTNLNPSDALEVGLQLATGSGNVSEAFVLQPASVRFPDGTLRAPSEGAPYAAAVTALLSSGALAGPVLSGLVFQVPPGQGQGRVYVKRTVLSSGIATVSLSAYAVTYASPALAGAVVSVGGAVVSAVALRGAFNTPRIRVPADTLAGGGTRLQLNGTNLGLYPVVSLGDGWTCAVSLWRSGGAPPFTFACTFQGATPEQAFAAPLTDCSAGASGGGAGSYSCWAFTPPRGEGSGPPPTGYTLLRAAGDSATTPTPFGYLLPRVTAVTSAVWSAAPSVAGGCPSRGGGYAPASPCALDVRAAVGAACLGRGACDVLLSSSALGEAAPVASLTLALAPLLVTVAPATPLAKASDISPACAGTH
jgi:hypothetical protein